MDYRFVFSEDRQTPVDDSPQAIGLELGEIYPVIAADKENRIDLDLLPQDMGQIDPEEVEEEDGEDGSDEELGYEDEDELDEELEDDDEDESRWREKIDAAIDEWEVDGEDKVDDMDFEALLRRVQSEIREELNRRGYHYIEGEMTYYSEGHKDASPAFFVPSIGCHASHFDLSITLKDRPHCCVRLKVKLPILCGPEMAPALLMHLAELNRSTYYFSWNYDSSGHTITLRATVPFWDGELSHKVMTTLMGCVICLPLMAFPELEWLSTGIITTKVDARQLEEMREFLQRLESSGPCLSPRALQHLRDRLAAVPPENGN